jgi:hypothetical protein
VPFRDEADDLLRPTESVPRLAILILLEATCLP